MQMTSRMGTPIAIDETAVTEQRTRLYGELLCPGASGYDAARTIFNGMFDRGWVRDAWDRLSHHATGAVYLNYLGRAEQEADKLVHAAFGPNYARLVECKLKYDPTSVFRTNQNIRLT